MLKLEAAAAAASAVADDAKRAAAEAGELSRAADEKSEVAADESDAIKTAQVQFTISAGATISVCIRSVEAIQSYMLQVGDEYGMINSYLRNANTIVIENGFNATRDVTLIYTWSANALRPSA